MIQAGLRIPRYLAILLLASTGWGLTVEFTASGTVVANPGDTPAPLGWTVSDPAATVTAAWTSTDASLGTWTVVPGSEAGTGTVTITLPLQAKPGTYSCKLTAKVGSTTATKSRQIRINKPPALSTPAQPVVWNVVEDKQDQRLTLAFTADDSPGSQYTFTLSAAAGGILESYDLTPSLGTSTTLSISPVPDVFTANQRAVPPIADAPAIVTLTATDVDGGVSVIPITITVANVNDPPLLAFRAGVVQELRHDPAAGALQTIIPLVDGLPDLVRSEPLDRDPTRLRAGATSTYLRWRCTVVAGVDGGDLLKPMGDGTTWQVSGANIQRANGVDSQGDTVWLTVATWKRSADGSALTNRSDHLTITLNAAAVLDDRRDDAAGVLHLVHYAWLLGTPPNDSPWMHRSISIVCDEPHDTVANQYDTSADFLRPIVLHPPNQPPLVSGLTMNANPLGDSPLTLEVLDDGRANGCADVGAVVLILMDPPHGGDLVDLDSGLAVQVEEGFTVARLDRIVYRHTDATVTVDGFELYASDGDHAVTERVSVDIAMAKARLGILSDPLLVLRRSASGTASWPLRFTHALTAPPVLRTYPGLASPTGVAIGGDAATGWRLDFTEELWPTGTGYVGFVVEAQTDPAAARLSAAVSQAMLVRLLDVPVGRN